jgi:putative transposase
VLAEGAWLRERTAGWVCSWRDYLADGDDEELAKSLRRHENTGRPMGEESFVQKIGHLLGRNLVPKKPGVLGTPYLTQR